MNEAQGCEYGYPDPCNKPATWRGHMPHYPYALHACDEHRLPMFGSMAVNYSSAPAYKTIEGKEFLIDYSQIANRWGSYSRYREAGIEEKNG